MFVEITPGDNLRDLKKIREERGLSLEDLFAQTRVRVAYLQAIENKEFNLLPFPVYSKNFIRIYARVLGIDGEPIIREYENYINSLKEPQLPQEDLSDKKNIFQNINRKKTYLIIAFILLVVIVTHWLITKRYEISPDTVSAPGINANVIPGSNGKNLNAAVPLETQVNPDFAAAQNENYGQSPVANQKAPIAGSKNVAAVNLTQTANIQIAPDKDIGLLVITATEETWMRIKADQNQPIKVLLKAGEKFEYKAKSFDIDIGNAGGIKVKFKGKNLENLGKTGEVVHLRLP